MAAAASSKFLVSFEMPSAFLFATKVLLLRVVFAREQRCRRRMSTPRLLLLLCIPLTSIFLQILTAVRRTDASLGRTDRVSLRNSAASLIPRLACALIIGPAGLENICAYRNVCLSVWPLFRKVGRRSRSLLSKSKQECLRYLPSLPFLPAKKSPSKEDYSSQLS